MRSRARLLILGAALALTLPAGAGIDVLQYVSTSSESSTQVLGDMLQLDDGTVLVAGTTDSLAWLSGVPNSTVSVARLGPGDLDNGAASGPSRVGFLLHLDTDMAPLNVVAFAPGAVQGLTRIRTSARPGNGTTALYISGTVTTSAHGSSYFVAKLDRNFIRGTPSAVVWARTFRADGDLATHQPWDVGSDGCVAAVTTASSGSATWSEVWALDSEGEPRVMRNWREHYTAEGALSHETPAPSGAVRSVVVLDSTAPLCGLRSWNSIDFAAYEADGNGGSRRGRWPWDVLFGMRCDTSNPSGTTGLGYTGARWGSGMAAVPTSLVVDRDTNDFYLGLHASDSASSVPAVISWSATGAMRWWVRLLSMNSLAANPEHAIAGLAIDYTNQRLVALVSTRGATDVGRPLWQHASGSGFQTTLGGLSSIISSGWLGALALSSGELQASTAVAELSVGRGASGNPGLVTYSSGPLVGFADVGQLPAMVTSLGDTVCSAVAVDASGRIYVSCTAGHTATTPDAFRRNVNVSGLGSNSGESTLTSFARVYSSALDAVEYSSLTGGSNLEPRSVLPVAGGLALTAIHTGGSAPPLPAAATWGGSVPQAASAGSSGVIGRLDVAGLPGWPVSNPNYCAAGSATFLNATGDTDFICAICDAGRYTAVNNAPVCLGCPAGRWSSTLGASAAAMCNACPAGTETIGAADSVEDCTECKPGSFSSAVSGFICEVCPAGRYATDWAQVECIACDLGRYSTQTNATSAAVCDACPVGRYASASGAGSLALGCPQCAKGKFSVAEAALACYSCAAGLYSATLGASNSTTCLACAAGKVAAEAAEVCSPCGAGRYSPSLRTACLDCPAGTASSQSAQSGSGSCSSCAVGLYAPPGSSSCSTCLVDSGSVSQRGYGSCYSCSSGAFSAASLAASASSGTIEHSSLQFGTFPAALNTSGESPPQWSDVSAASVSAVAGAAAAGALLLDAGESVTQHVSFSHVNRAPVVAGGVFAALPTSSGGTLAADPPTLTVRAHFGGGSSLMLAQAAVEVSSTGNRSASVWPPPALWHGAYAGFGDNLAFVSDGRSATGVSLTLSTTTVAGYWDDVFLTVDPRVACWCGSGYAYDAAAATCVRCQAGFYCAPKPLPSHKYLSLSHRVHGATLTPSSCAGNDGLQIPCPEKTFSSGGASVCSPCPDGFSCVDGEVITCFGYDYLVGETCQPCPAGSACVNARREICGPGTWSDGRKHFCVPCVPGRYQSATAATSCINCIAGQASTVKNSECFACPSGESSDGNAGPCTSCGDGKFSREANTTDVCVACPVGRFNDQGPVEVCQACPNGTSSSIGAATCA